MSPTTVLFLHIQDYVPYGSVIPTWIDMSHTAVLNLHIKSYSPTVVLSLHAQNTAGWVNESPQKMGIIDNIDNLNI